MSEVCVTGLGYVGLPSAALLAARGHRVWGCDTSAAVVAAVNGACPHFQEPDLAMLLQAAVQTGRLSAGPSPVAADYHLIAVPTPFTADRRPDLSFLHAAGDAIAPLLRPGDCVIVESTCPVGATEGLAARLALARPDLRLPALGRPGDIHIAHCPERVLPGQALKELIANDRIIGGMTPGCAARARALYESFATGACLVTDCRTAEFAKLSENAYRDANIAFANELAGIAEAVGVDIWQAIALANRHPRVGILRPGPGVGGHCIAVDPWFLVDAAPDAAPLIRTARAVNDARPRDVAARLRAMAARLKAPRLAILGLSYKPDIEDLRESPALAIAVEMAGETGLELMVVEPHLAALPASLAGRARQVTLAEALEEADIIAILVAHRAFHGLRPEGKMVLDTVGLLA
ncbi:UDP-N-acetyl-D-mannosamine dehydrogenase [Rhodovarius crocodyli]|uniref:UDP-N-acetyl-D-mannosamine dehydrogenase n=1 Tax=Rhodovarius crocodyli TaxID=1979269 RepID=A0A437MJ90_9PROT|nr:UDP-N-acetyl-D-mannosamine dehydrogenase [Rhodovarius crocodyli]RVT97693.1 UDP-N-acetyl-D-mannosamine dehydrogenase [Rhodovarius crocodyli]